MTNAIPISQIVNVNPGVLSAAGNAVNLNGLILTQSTYAPMGQAIPFADSADVASYFGPQSVEAAMAKIYFNGYQNSTKTPGLLYFAQYNAAAVPAWVRGASIASMTLAQLQAVTGAFSIVIDAVAHQATINLSAATSFSNAAQLMSTQLGVNVAFDELHQAFVITDVATGVASSALAATGAAATALGMDTPSGAIVSQGANAAMPGSFMDSIILSVTQNWALFSTAWESVITDKIAFSTWANSTQNRFGYVGYDSDAQAKVAGSTEPWGYTLQSLQLDGSVPIFGDYTHAAFVLGYAASLDFSRLNGRATLAFKTQSGLAPSVTNASDSAALKQNGYNWFGAYATAINNFNFMYPGSVSGEWVWLDSFLDQIWLNANLQLSMITLLTSVGSLPYNSQGYATIEAACMDPISSAVNFGAIRTGVSLSSAQVAEMQNALGFDVSATIEAKGYYLQIQPATAAIRIARASPSMTLFYTDGGSIQQLTLASIAVM